MSSQVSSSISDGPSICLRRPNKDWRVFDMPLRKMPNARVSSECKQGEISVNIQDKSIHAGHVQNNPACATAYAIIGSPAVRSWFSARTGWRRATGQADMTDDHLT